MLCTGDILKNHIKLYFSDSLCTGNPARLRKRIVGDVCGTISGEGVCSLVASKPRITLSRDTSDYTVGETGVLPPGVIN